MSDIFEKVVSEQDGLTKLIAKVPGFKGYVERADRRMADKLLREKVADAFEPLYQRTSSLQRQLISQGGLKYVDDLEAAAIKLRQFIDRVRTASYGYAGIFDAIKIKQDDLAQVYQYDLQLLSLSETVSHAIDNVEVSIGTDGLVAAIQNLVSATQNCLDVFNKRSEALKGLIPENQA